MYVKFSFPMLCLSCNFFFCLSLSSENLQSYIYASHIWKDNQVAGIHNEVADIQAEYEDFLIRYESQVDEIINCLVLYLFMYFSCIK